MCVDDVQEPMVFSRAVSMPNVEELQSLEEAAHAHAKLIRENSGKKISIFGYDCSVVVIAYCIVEATFYPEIVEPVAEEGDVYCGREGNAGCFNPDGTDIPWVQCDG